MTTETILEIANLSYHYPSQRTVLDSISFHIHTGECVGLVGPNGAGKTTLFHCSAGLLSDYQGEIKLAGYHPNRARDRKQIPQHLGILFQDSDDQIIHATVQEDVAFGPLNLGLDPEEVRQRVADAIEQVGLKGFENRVPFQLSGGEKRRVALAGLLAMKPQLILFDEPSIFLDARGRRDLIRLLQGLPMARLIASHDLKLIEQTCSRLLVMDQGKLIRQGDTAEILRDRAWLEDLGID
jgi:cobalt/nickel transport system ATP-binding protein